MKYFLSFFLLLLMVSTCLHAQVHRKRKYKAVPRTEVDIINSIIICLQNKDTASYYNLFPPFDSLWHMVMHNTDNSPEAQKELSVLKEHPQSLIEFDPLYNHDIIGRFGNILAKGEDSGIIWKSVVLQRYELQKDFLTRNLQGYDLIAPERFKGYVFIRDLLTRRTFCVTVCEIQKLKGNFFGGQVINILEASNIDQYLLKEQRERRYYEWLAANPDTTAKGAGNDSLKGKSDTTAAGGKKKSLLGLASDDDDDTKKRKEVIDRKYYEGMFDNEIPVKLYVRYMKDIGGKVFSYDGLYKFGDQKKYIKLEISINEEGKWIMEDEVPIGMMELALKGKTYTGTWSNNDENGYDVLLALTPVPQKKIELLDKILDQGVSGRVDEGSFQEPEKKEDKKKTGGKDKEGEKNSDKDKKKDRDRDEDKKGEKEKPKEKKADKEQGKEDDKDSEWDKEQQKAKEKERKKFKKFYKPKEED